MEKTYCFYVQRGSFYNYCSKLQIRYYKTLGIPTFTIELFIKDVAGHFDVVFFACVHASPL